MFTNWAMRDPIYFYQHGFWWGFAMGVTFCVLVWPLVFRWLRKGVWRG